MVKSVADLMETVEDLKKQLEQLNREKAGNLSKTLVNNVENINGVNFIAAQVDFDAATVKDLSFKVKSGSGKPNAAADYRIGRQSIPFIDSQR